MRDRDAFGKLGVSTIDPGVYVTLSIGPEIYDLVGGVYAGISASRTGYANR